MKSKVKKVILASHLLREYEGYTSSWLPSLFKKHIELTTGLPVEIVVPSNFSAINLEDYFVPFDYVKFCGFYGISYTREAWGALFYNREYNEQAYKYIESVFKDSLVISYEMDACILNILDELGIPYIDMYISPIRFLEDQLFSMTSNDSEIYAKLLSYRLPEELIYMQANYLKTFYLMRDAKKIQEIPAVLFIGQTQFDRSLINPKTGEIYSILNHKQEFEDSIRGFGRILYKRHPKASGDSSVLEYLRTLGDVKIVDENFYAMISRHDIKKVIAISSGGLIEAKYFGKETQHLLHSSVNLQYGNDFDKEKYINIYEHFFALHFWADVLSPFIQTKDYPKEFSFYGSKNKLRNSRGGRDYWGYQDIDHEMVKLEILSKTMPKSFNSLSRKALRLMYHMTYNKQIFDFYQKIQNS